MMSLKESGWWASAGATGPCQRTGRGLPIIVNRPSARVVVTDFFSAPLEIGRYVPATMQ